MGNLAEYKRLNTRQASALQIGGFRPTLDPSASNFGRAPLGLSGEEWPCWNDLPLMFVCQINLSTAPAVPALLADIKLLTFFVDPEHGSLSEESGDDWCLHAYRCLDDLAPMAAPPQVPKLKKAFECLWQAIDDHPNHDDSERVPVSGVRHPSANFDNVARSKIGGYATTIQSDPWWGFREHPANPKFCLQINSEEKAGLFWGDAGALYIARGTTAGYEQKWYLDWQCF